MFLETAFLCSYALFLLRVVIAIFYFQGESMGMPYSITALLGVSEMLAAISLALGVGRCCG